MDLKTWATGGFEGFKGVWDFEDFWKRSNTFHAFLCFVDAAEQNWPGDPEVGDMSSLRNDMIDGNSSFFDKYIGGPSVWCDDYGWCGISCLAAYDYLRWVGDDDRAGVYLARAERCWEQMLQVGYDATDQARPVPHGCGNISPDRKKTPQDYGTKNTVTNTNLLLLSLRLYNAVRGTDPTRAARYLSMAHAQYQWFSTWFLDEYQSEDDGHYLRRMPGPMFLIHERPMAKPDYLKKDFPTWQPGWVWTGDQGLLLAGMVELLLVGDDLLAWTSANQVPGFDPAKFENSIGDVITSLVAGMSSLFVAPDKVLREPPFSSSFGIEYGLDYVGGRGVLLRYVSEKSVQRALGGRFNPSGIAATAEAVWNSCESENQFDSLWNKANDSVFNKNFVDWWGSGDIGITEWELGSDLKSKKVRGVVQATGLDALTAAMRYNLT
ncbi:MAG TPA: hypothetical protein VNZ44_15135 [Pyrinomonadaceae bacterium]|nr:hypothetical protein [Pyrinomonadaceae bacterium]